MSDDQPRNHREEYDTRTGSQPLRGLLPSTDHGWPPSQQVPSSAYYARRVSDTPTLVDIEATVPPQLAYLAIDIPSPIITASVEAERDLARLDQQATAISSDVLEAVTTSLLRAESLSSSRIEGLEISHRRLSEAFYDPAAAKRLTREVANNTNALQHAISLGSERRPLSTSDLCDIHTILMDDVPGIAGGELRTVQNWIGPSDDPREAVFVPPPVGDVELLLDDLCAFVERDDVPATIRAAIGHAQFEAIHPFPDGNGRVGRCLISIVLRRGADTDVIPPISGVCAADTGRYFDALQEFQQRANPWPWVSQFCEATKAASNTARNLADEIVELQQEWLERAGKPRAGSIANRLIAALPTMSFTDADLVAERLGVDPNVARRGLNKLEEAGVLSPIAGRKRNRVWRADDFHLLLDRSSASLEPPDD